MSIRPLNQLPVQVAGAADLAAVVHHIQVKVQQQGGERDLGVGPSAGPVGWVSRVEPQAGRDRRRATTDRPAPERHAAARSPAVPAVRGPEP